MSCYFVLDDVASDLIQSQWMIRNVRVSLSTLNRCTLNRMSNTETFGFLVGHSVYSASIQCRQLNFNITHPSLLNHYPAVARLYHATFIRCMGNDEGGNLWFCVTIEIEKQTIHHHLFCFSGFNDRLTEVEYVNDLSLCSSRSFASILYCLLQSLIVFLIKILLRGALMLWR